MMYSLDEIGLIPSQISGIKHRGDVNPFCDKGKLPIFVAPMTCILGVNNILTFAKSKVYPILPVVDAPLELRTQMPDGSSWGGWTALTLDEFKHLFNTCTTPEGVDYHILIDVANGHMEELYKVVKDAKQEYGDALTIMIGNIANPETYLECCKAGVDYVRIGIGGGSGCTTSVQTGIHTSMPYILEGIREVKNVLDITCANDFRTKVVADGGITTISRAIKALALGADYVMMGKAFAECKEGTTNDIYGGVFHLYYGQSSKEGQKDRFGKIKANPEGTASMVKVTTDLAEFTAKFEAALRSAMSYCGAHNLEEFIGKAKYEIMSPVEFNAYNK